MNRQQLRDDTEETMGILGAERKGKLSANVELGIGDTVSRQSPNQCPEQRPAQLAG